MAAPTNTETTLTSVGQREALADAIHRVAPEKTPFYSSLASKTATARLEEWQVEALRDPDAENAQLEGDDVTTLDPPNRTERVGVYNQIFRETGGVSETAEAVDMAGRSSEMKRQKVVKGLEVRRDVEKRALGNYASQNESGSNPRKTAGIQAWLETNTDRGVGGVDGGFQTGGTVNAATAGTARVFAESQIKTVMNSCFSNGGQPSRVFLGPTHKQTFSSFDGIAEKRVQVRGREQAIISAAADVYVSDFGSLDIIPHPYALSSEAVFIDPDMVEMRVLRGWGSKELPSNGDNEKFMNIFEACLCVKNEKAHGVIADLS